MPAAAPASQAVANAIKPARPLSPRAKLAYTVGLYLAMATFAVAVLGLMIVAGEREMEMEERRERERGRKKAQLRPYFSSFEGSKKNSTPTSFLSLEPRAPTPAL